MGQNTSKQLPKELCDELAILTTNGWEVTLTYTSEERFMVFAMRGIWVMRFAYRDGDYDLTYPGSLRMLRYKGTEPMRLITRWEMRIAATKSDKDLEDVVVGGIG